MLFFKSLIVALPFVASMVAALPAGANSAEVQKRDLQASQVKDIVANLNTQVVSLVF